MAEEFTPKTPHPGDIIHHSFLDPWRMSAYRLAKGTGMSQTRVSEILNGKRAITAETALRLSRFLGCSPEFWLGLQASYDLRETSKKLGAELEQIERYVHEGPVYDEEGNPFPEEETGELQDVA